MPVRYRALRDACEVQGFERCLWGTGLFIFHVASLCRVIKCDKEVTFHVVRPCQEWEINKLIHGVFKFKWNLTYSRQVSRARPNDSVHKIHVGYYTATQGAWSQVLESSSNARVTLCGKVIMIERLLSGHLDMTPVFLVAALWKY